MEEPLSLWATCVATLCIAASAGLASLLRSRKDLTPRNIFSAMLNSGIVGLVVGLMWYQMFDGKQHVLFMICVSALAGLGGTSLIDLILHFAQGNGVQITLDIKRSEKSKNASEDEE